MARKINPALMLLLIACAFAALLWAQSGAFLSATASAPQGVIISAASTIGMPAGGGSTIYYFIYARFPGGFVAPVTPTLATRTYGAAALSVSSYVRLTWTAVSGATGYDVIRSNSATAPEFPCTACAVVLNTSSTTVDDIGGVMSNYPPGGLSANGGAVAYFTLENRTEAMPFVNLEIIKGGVSLSGRILRLIGSANDDDCLKFSAAYGAAVSAGAACGSGGGGGGDMVLASIQTSTGRKSFQPTATNAGARIVCAALPSAPGAGDYACDSGDSNKYKYYDGSTWTALTIGGGVGVSLQLQDFTLTGMGSPTIVLGTCTSGLPCQARFGSKTAAVLTASSPATISGFVGAQTVFVYLRMNGGTAQCVYGANTATIVPTGACVYVPGITDFPRYTIPIASCTITNTTWDLGGCTDARAYLSTAQARAVASGYLTDSVASDGSVELDWNPTAAPRPCQILIGNKKTGASPVDDTEDAPQVCTNVSGHTQTILRVRCFADAGTPTIDVTAGGGGSSILTGPLTCGTGAWATGTLAAGPPTQADDATLDVNVVSAGGTAKYILVEIKKTF